MKLSNEIKVGAIVTAAIAGLIWGINFLKGTDLFTNTNTIYAIYDNIDGLVASNRVIINGYRIGQVKKIRFLPDNSGKMIAMLTVRPDIFIPKNSIARIVSSDFFGGKAIQIELGNDKRQVEDGDTLNSELKSGIEQQLGPVKDKAERLIESLDSVATAFHILMDASTRKNISSSFSHLTGVLANLEQATAALNTMISDGGKLKHTIDNIESISSNLKNSNEKISNILTNFSSVSDSLAKADLTTTINNLSKSAADLSTILDKVNKGTGSLGKMVNDDSLYTNLTSTMATLDTLLLDLKTNPKRYVHFSMFGKNPK
ncbi:MAG: MlaD family protein [Bacteroidia bacterium]